MLNRWTTWGKEGAEEERWRFFYWWRENRRRKKRGSYGWMRSGSWNWNFRDHITAAIDRSLKGSCWIRERKKWWQTHRPQLASFLEKKKHPWEECLTQQWSPLGKIQDGNTTNYSVNASDEFCDFNLTTSSTRSHRYWLFRLRFCLKPILLPS